MGGGAPYVSTFVPIARASNPKHLNVKINGKLKIGNEIR